MPVPGHRQSPPDKGKTKSRSNNKVTTAVFPYTTFRFGKKAMTKKALRTSFFLSAKFSAEQKTSSYEKSRTEKVSKQVF